MWLGSHNSLSYLKPRQWWLRPFAWVGRCQSLTIPEQWNHGVRYFDIRIRFKVDKVISGHGLIDYDVNMWDWLEYLNKRAESEKVKCVVRLMLETKGRNDDARFKCYVKVWKSFYPNLIFVGGLRKEPFEVIAEVDSVPEKHCYQLFQDYSAKTLWQKLKGIKFPYPRYWAKRKNNEYRQNAKDGVYTILDFVEI